MKLATFLLVALLSGCATAAVDAQAPVSAPALTLDWNESCRPDSRRIFRLELFADGRVRYDGGAQARLAGEQSARVSAAVVSSIEKTAAAAARESLRVAKSGKGAERSAPGGRELCISVAAQGASGGGQLLSSEGKATQALIDLVNEKIDPRQWACPTRQTLGQDSLNGNYCGRPRILVDFEDEASCGGRNVVFIYGDGTIHYYFVASPWQESQELGHYFARISQADLDRTLALMRTFVMTSRVVDVDASEDGSSANDYYGTYGRASDVLKLKHHLSSLAPIPWARTAAPGASCPTQRGPSPFGTASLLSPFLDGSWSLRYRGRSR